jgi:hypothetical protein
MSAPQSAEPLDEHDVHLPLILQDQVHHMRGIPGTEAPATHLPSGLSLLWGGPFHGAVSRTLCTSQYASKNSVGSAASCSCASGYTTIRYTYTCWPSRLLSRAFISSPEILPSGALRVRRICSH